MSRWLRAEASCGDFNLSWARAAYGEGAQRMGIQGYSKTSMVEIDRSYTSKSTRAKQARAGGCAWSRSRRDTWQACSHPADSCSRKTAGQDSCNAICMCRDDSWAHPVVPSRLCPLEVTSHPVGNHNLYGSSTNSGWSHWG